MKEEPEENPPIVINDGSRVSGSRINVLDNAIDLHPPLGAASALPLGVHAKSVSMGEGVWRET